MPTLASALLSTGYTAAYLSSLYLIPAARVDSSPPAAPTLAAEGSDRDPLLPDATLAEAIPPSGNPPRDRNDPTVIRARLLGVSLSTLLSCASVRFVLPVAPAPTITLVDLLGLSLPKEPVEMVNLVVLPLGLTASLFLGSLYIIWLQEELPGQRGWSFKGFRQNLNGLQGLRNYVVGPLTEELVFRSCIVGVSFLGGMSKSQLVFLTPMYFGIAHLHHAWETYVKGGRTRQALFQGAFQSSFQFAYTTLFGWYATFIFMRTGSVLPPLLVHSFCNAMGLPPLAWALQVFSDYKRSLWGTYAVGIAVFIYGFWRWTEPAFFGDSLYWH